MEKGFTLFEVLIVLLLMSILLLINMPHWKNSQYSQSFLLEQQRLYAFLRQLQVRVENSTEIWLLIAQRNMLQKRWCLTGQIKDDQICDCLNPINCPSHLMAHFYYPQAPDTMIAAKRYYPSILTRLNGIKNTFESSCFTLQSEQNRVFFSFSSDGIMSIKPSDAATACRNYEEN
ncbi:prepilin-type N-terminal cleavage/methylation domain-containing protein [Pasteurellaceae bacterium LIM206]|nr:prepilin-type N-terminal cleavage/methylation domain-containing protein [Pasteurellaceae bacterium LIM206]